MNCRASSTVPPVIIRDYRFSEGWAAFNMGFNGPNPYPYGSESARHWSEGYTSSQQRQNAQADTPCKIMAQALRRIADECPDHLTQIIARNALNATA